MTSSTAGLVLGLFPIFFLISSTSAACTFPTEVIGSWTSGKRGDFVITSQFIYNFTLDKVGRKDFTCLEQYGDRYIVKTTETFSYIANNLIFSALMCLDFRTVNPDFLYYYLGSDVSVSERVIFNLGDANMTAEQVCKVQPADYAVQAYDVMIKNGNIEAAKSVCPRALQYYWNYEINRGGDNLCSNETTMTVCSHSLVTLNYTQCNTTIGYSASGELFCLLSLENPTTSYVTLYNNDSNVDDVNTFRFSCWAFSSSGDDLYMTQHPRLCSESQNGTFVDLTVGAQLFLTNGSVCYTPAPEDLTWLYATIGCLAGAFLIIAIIVVLYFFNKYKAKQKPFRGGLEPANVSPKVPHMMNGTFKPSPGIPENDAPVNVMQLLRKELSTPAGRDSPSSNFNMTITTPPQLFNIRETDSYGPSPTIESPNQKKDYHVLGGVDHADYGDLTHDEERTSRTPVMVLPVKKAGFATEELEDDYDDDDDDDLLTTPGRSRLVAATQGMHGADAMCPPTHLPGIAEDVTMTQGELSRVGGGKPFIISPSNNITFLNEHGMPLPPIQQTPRECVETVRDSNSKLRVKSKRRASLTKDPKNLRGEMQDPPDIRAAPEADRGEDSSKIEMVFKDIKANKKVETGIGPASARSASVKKGGKQPGALLRSRSLALENRRGEQERRDGRNAKNTTPEIEVKVKDTSETANSPKEGKVTTAISSGGTNHHKKHHGHVKKETPRQRPKTVSGTRDTAAKQKGDSATPTTEKHHSHSHSVADPEETSRPRSSLRLTRIDIPDLTPPVPGNKPAPKPARNEVVDSPGRFSLNKHQDSPSDAKPRRMWLDPDRPNTQVWGQMSSVWRDGQAWPH